MGVITTNEANCKDCYKCVRCCPVKAIRISSGRAQIIKERCIADGRCIRECPQNAKGVRSDLERIKGWLKEGKHVAVSLAPSFAAAFEQADKLSQALKMLGFDAVGETADAAEKVALEHLNFAASSNDAVITSCCPVVVSLVEKYHPELIPYLAPVVSPMTAHARILKHRLGSEDNLDDIKVVFIGPCVAKKEEMLEPDGEEAVDAVLTFDELKAWFEEESILLSDLAGGLTDDNTSSDSRTFPLAGGFFKTAKMGSDALDLKTITVTGLEECIEVLESFTKIREGVSLIEMLACTGGCIGGVGMGTAESVLARRQRVLKYAASVKQIKPDKQQMEKGYDCIAFGRGYQDKTIKVRTSSEKEIREVLAKIGKHNIEDELNCGACGYNSCREKAGAVLQGMAEREMCLPYMRERAESMSNVVINSTPNGIVVVNRDLEILDINPAGEKMFECHKEMVKGTNLLITIIQPDDFIIAFQEKKAICREVKYSNDLYVRQYIFHVAKQDIVVGLFTDMTTEKKQQEKLGQVKTETLEKAQQVINKQMRVAQEIAGLLGETTAETKVLLTKLMRLMDNQEGRRD